MDYKINIEELKNLSKTNNEDIQGIVLIHIPEMYGETRSNTISKIKTSNIDKKDYGLHFVFDDTKNTIYQLVDKKYKTEFLKGKATYISKALFSQDPNGKVIYIYTHIHNNNKYEETEEKLIRFLVTLLREFKLTAKDVWRGFDLDGNDYSPLHLLDKDIFEKYITEIEKFIPPVKSTLEGVNGNPDKFIEVIAPGAVKVYKKHNILPSLIMAQAALESGWGKAAIGNNLFGIKAFDDWTGKKKKVWTTEYNENGVAYKTEAWFRDYDSIDDAIEDHAQVLLNPRYDKVRQAKNYKEATQAVKDGGYATDPNYPSLLNSLIEQYNMDKYDNSSTFDVSTIDDEVIDDDKITIVSPFKDAAKKAGKTIDEYINDIYKENKDDPKSYASKFSPWDKDRLDTKEDNPSGEITTMTTPFNNTIVYKISQSAPKNICDCEKPSDFIEAVETTQETLVEPIYPDLVVPPGGEIHIADGFSNTEVQSSSDTPLNAEEFEKRQKTFDFSQFSNIKKETNGRPANPEDPFPVDDQIKKLEEHYPKVKIDKTTFNFKDDNHLNSEIGNAMIQNLAMTYDMVNEVAKRTEQRLVKIENNLSTVMRNLFRMSSRVNINCVYYGGQSVYGKYKCIRCLDDHRVNDGAIVTIDQCLNCTRYEPVLGQVYAILDETGSNVVQVMDDMQMAYLGIQDYTDLNSINGYYKGQTNAKVDDIPGETPKSFIEDKWKDEEDEKEEETDLTAEDSEEISEKKTEDTQEEKVNGFKMDWNPVALETQKPNVNEYDIEGLKADKKAISSDRQEIDRTIFKDTREQAVEYDKLEFNIKDYTFSNFGDSSSNTSSSDGTFGMGATEVRQKIVDYALKAVEMSSQGIAFYSQPNRYAHMDDAINGKHYWDCSSLVQRAYESAGISGIGTYTANQYPHCLESAGGLLIPIKNVDQALPGDMVWFKEPPIPTTKEELQKVNYGDTSLVHHIGIYIGDNKYAHAAYAGANPDIKISTLGYYSHELCFGRVKALIDLDRAASQGGTGSDAWDKAAQGITDELWNASKVADSNVSGMVDNMNKYGYKEVLKEAAKAKGYDPYFIAAIIAIETTGNPLAGGNYPGIMQCTSGYATTTLNGIKDNILKGCDALTVKANWLKSKGWTENNMPLLATAHNCGQYGTTDALGHTHETYPSVAIPMMGKVYDLNKITVQEASKVIADYTATYQKYWNVEEKRTYACKVLRAYNSLINQKALT